MREKIIFDVLKAPLILLLIITVSGCVSTAPQPNATKLITDQTFGQYDEQLEAGLILITMTPKTHARLTNLQPAPMNAEIPPEYAEFVSRLSTKYGIKRVANWPLPAIEIYCIVFEIQDTDKRPEVVEALAKEPGIETAQIVQTFETQAKQYNDPYLSVQHAVHSIKALHSHEWSLGKGVKIAVVDTGMDNKHSEIASNTEVTMNFVDSDETRFRSDTHGTAVGGVIAANANNLKGMVGIAPDATLIAIKACWHTEFDNSKALCNSLTLAKALNYAIRQKVDIINLSLTGLPDPVLQRLVLEALANNIVVIGAKPAHNKQAFPISIPGTIVVAMSDNNSQTISAPGRHVLSLEPNEQYDFFDGSSFSTAHISGLAALLRSLTPELSPSNLLALLESTANPETGAVNACRAVATIIRRDDQQLSSDVCS